MDARLRRIERSGDRRALAYGYARMGQSREAYGIMIDCLKGELEAAKESRAANSAAVTEAGQARFKEAGGCMQCLGVGYIYLQDSWKRIGCACSGKGSTDRRLLLKTREDRESDYHLGQAVNMAKKELAAWQPLIERGDLVMYDNERARAKFSRDGREAGERVPCYTCGTVTWAQITARCRIEVITGPNTGMSFYTSISNISHVNAWKKVMEKEGVMARLALYKPKRNDWVWCRGHYGRVTRVTHLRGTATLGVGLRTPGNLFYWFPAHECRQGEAPKSNLLENMV